MFCPSHPLWLIHGWAANHFVFDPLRDCLPRAFQATSHAPDLPGHGAAPLSGAFDLAAIADDYAAHMPAPVHLFGWSLGGMVAVVLAARHPDKVATLCLTASLAKLMACADYPEGLSREALSSMVVPFTQNYHKYMGQFLALQMMYVPPENRQALRALLPRICQYGAPSGLAAALTTLLQADVRPLLAQIRCPCLLIFGARDALTPPRMGEYLQAHLPHSRLVVLPHAAHAPFLSHPQACAELLVPFWAQKEHAHDLG